MPLSWGGIGSVQDELLPDEQLEVRQVLDALGDAVGAALDARAIPRHRSPLFRPFHMISVLNAGTVVAAFASLTGGIAERKWLRPTGGSISPDDLASAARNQLGWDVLYAVGLPRNGDAQGTAVGAAALDHVQSVENANAIARVRGTDAIPHLIPYLRDFLTDHPDPDLNVFIMMRFRESNHMRRIHATLQTVLARHGMTGLRADDKDYTGELWTNLQLYMTGSHFGVAVFEDIDERDFNPNVSLELGYMLGTGRRCLLLKERRLPRLPADVVNRLYKPFDAFRIEETITAEIERWVTVDLGR